MNILIPLSNYSDNDFFELRMALRGLQSFVKVDDLAIIGARPKWINWKLAVHIDCGDNTETAFRERNIFNKVCKSPFKEFLYFSDDNFLLAKIDWIKYFPFDKHLQNKLYTLQRGSQYMKTVSNTMRIFPKAHNFDVHAPIYIDLAKWQMLEKFDWKKPYCYCMKSLYCTMHNIQGTAEDDLKLREPVTDLAKVIAGRKWFSSADGIFNDSMKKQMQIIYLNKSKWE